MPYLQLDLDAKHKVPRVARACGLSEAVVGWGLMDLWEWCWREKVDRVSSVALAGFFGTCEVLAEALCAFHFLERVDGAYRVRGAEKYLKISRKRAEAGATRAAGATRDSAGRLTSKSPASAGEATSKLPATDQLLHPATQLPNNPTTQQQQQPPPASKFRRAMLPGTLEPPPAPEREWGPWEFWVWFQYKREKAGLVRGKQPTDEELEAFWADVKAAGCSMARLKEAAYAFGLDPYWREENLPFRAFCAQWQDFAPREVKT